MFDTVLIANRGEIACRIQRTLKRLGIRSVAVFSEADAGARHVVDADRAVLLGPAPVSQSYANPEAVLRAVRESGARAVHPGYGLLSENAAFAAACEAEGVCFVGPTPAQIEGFGLKHRARELAHASGVPLLPGTGLLSSRDEAQNAAARLGFPLMLKSTAGGGGIGLTLCREQRDLEVSFESVQRLGKNNFNDAGVYLERFVERARHIEVQILGDGHGQVVTLGDRDCSLQRRNQKVVEECPAPNLPRPLRERMHAAALELGRAVRYRSVGTVEFIVDAEREAFYFLEVNTRLQVEHTVTEAVFSLDLVEWMLLLAAGEAPPLAGYAPEPRGHALQARIYAEDPGRNFQPSAGLLTSVRVPDGVRWDGGVELGTIVTPHYDPLLGKIIAHGSSREAALRALLSALDESQFAGVQTNLEYLRQVLRDPTFTAGRSTTGHLKTIAYRTSSIAVLAPGMLSLVVDYPGRLGYWDVGIPPSGPMDHLAFRLANRIVGNKQGEAGLELTVLGPKLRFDGSAVIALTGADMRALLDGASIERWVPISVKAGQTLELDSIKGPGARAYLAVRGGLDVPAYLGSRTTFTLGGFGGHAGRALRAGDVLHRASSAPADEARALDAAFIPEYGKSWTVGVMYGPHGAPDFFTDRDIEGFFSTDFEVHYNSARTGVRLIGPKPEWARADGGEAGLHPSNIHDTAYAVGSVDFTGDMPIILGPDGPSLGGFVCPAVVVKSELWKVGQLAAGDTLRFFRVSQREAAEIERRQDAGIRDLGNSLWAKASSVDVEQRRASGSPAPRADAADIESAILAELPEQPESPRVVYRNSGDEYLLVEYGPQVLDLGLRLRVQALMTRLSERRLDGVIDLTPGIRSLQVHHDSQRLSRETLLRELMDAESELSRTKVLEVPTRILRLPLAWDDSQTRLAIQKYEQSVRKDAPWTPSNLEFIRRINGLESIEDVKQVVFAASYLVLGLGDVYLGAPVATPVDPRHRLVTTKYNPARTWTPENAVGIGGAYLCIYGMEGPGGYQFVGRTLQVFNPFRETKNFVSGKPWLLRFFDQIRFYPVEETELLEMRRDFLSGRFVLEVQSELFSLPVYEKFLRDNASSIEGFKARQQRAFESERERWQATGQVTDLGASDPPAPNEVQAELAKGSLAVESHVHGSVWKLSVTPGSRVERGQTLVVVEAMKMEIAIESSATGTVVEVLCAVGQSVVPGQRVVIVRSENSPQMDT